MKIIISGKSGYLGNLVSAELEKRNHKIYGLSREDLYGPIAKLAEKINGADVVINLAGSTILQRWTKKKKKNIYNSRVVTAQNLVLAIKCLPEKHQPKKFITASAIGIYKSGFLHDESSTNYDDGFVGLVVKNWEQQLDGLPENIQKIIFRMGIVLGKRSKTITKLLLTFKSGLGATIGNGRQSFPFIHEKDVTRAFAWAVEAYDSSEIFNLTAPERIDNKTFTKELAQRFHHSAFLFVPGFVLKIVYGKASELFINSPEISSDKITKAGFKFNFPDIHSTMKEII